MSSSPLHLLDLLLRVIISRLHVAPSFEFKQSFIKASLVPAANPCWYLLTRRKVGSTHLRKLQAPARRPSRSATNLVLAGNKGRRRSCNNFIQGFVQSFAHSTQPGAFFKVSTKAPAPRPSFRFGAFCWSIALALDTGPEANHGVLQRAAQSCERIDLWERKHQRKDEWKQQDEWEATNSP